MTRKTSIRFPLVLFIFAALVLTIWLGYEGYVNYAPVKPFLIYYGGLPTAEKQANAFVKRLVGYSVVVLGTGLNDPTIASKIIHLGQKSSQPIRFYGYISIGVTHQAGNLSESTVRSRLLQWKNIGANGVLYDTAGPDFGVSHKRLERLIKMAHQTGLQVIVNSWYPQALLDAGLTVSDGYLAENWYVSDGRLRSVPSGAAYIQLLKRQGIPIYMTATGAARINAISPTTLRAWIAGSQKVAAGEFIAIADENYSADSDYIEPAATLKKLIQSFYPFGL